MAHKKIQEDGNMKEKITTVNRNLEMYWRPMQRLRLSKETLQHVDDIPTTPVAAEHIGKLSDVLSEKLTNLVRRHNTNMKGVLESIHKKQNI